MQFTCIMQGKRMVLLLSISRLVRLYFDYGLRRRLLGALLRVNPLFNTDILIPEQLSAI